MTQGAIDRIAKTFPEYAITLSHQFLSGDQANPAGLIPNDWNGGRVFVLGKWWRGQAKMLRVEKQDWPEVKAVFDAAGQRLGTLRSS